MTVRTADTGTVAGVRLTHPDKVLYPEQGITKQGLAEFYVDIADYVLPHLVERPLSLVRCPEGAGKQCFYQKHPGNSAPDALRRIDIILSVGRDDPSCANNEYLSGVLWSKDIWHALRIWDGWAHDWPYWQQMIGLYIDGHD